MTERAARLFKTANGISGAIVDWNDHPDRAHEQILAAFDTAIQAAS